MFKVYWTDADGMSNGMSFKQAHVAEAFTETLKELDNTFIVMVEAV
jgi:hypothetical protein